MSEEIIIDNHWLVITNPKAGIRKLPKQREFIIHTLNQAGIPYIYKETEYSGHAIEIAKQRLSLENLKATLIIGDIINLPFETNYFDGIIDVECIYCNNWENTEIILQEIQRTLKTKGLFYSRTFAEDMFVGDAKCVKKMNIMIFQKGH